MSEPRLLSPSDATPWDTPAEASDRVDEAMARTVDERVSLHFAELSDAVFRYLAYSCRDARDAEEITQETFLRLYRSLERSETIGNVRHWVFKVARNLMLDRIKHLGRQARRVCEMPEDVHDIVRCPRPSPEDVMIEEARRTQLRAAVDSLTPLQRDCIHLRSQGLRLREIGDILKMDLRRVAEALNRAVTTLQKALDV